MVVPTGMFSVAIDVLRNTVASSPTFQAWTGTASEALAKPRIHAFDAAALATLPLAAVEFSSAYERRIISKGSHNQFMAKGGLHLLFRDAITEPLDIDAAYDFMNEVGGVIADMELVAGQATYLDITAITLLEGPSRPEENEKQGIGDYYEVVYTVEFDSK